MRRFRMTAALKHLFNRSQSGQSIVILAIGFVALIGFVGIVTDVSLLFVRYSTLRRAVDAAAVAAAGQMRRVDDPSIVNGVDTTPNIAEDQSISFSNMNLAARQFIEFYGLNPSEVIVETCWVQNRDIPVEGRDPLLCRTDERKLVRVTAQIESPTTFFNLFGFRTIRLEASSTSETAVLDMVFIMDVSESMLVDTDYREWQNAGYPYAYLPPVLPLVTGTNCFPGGTTAPNPEGVCEIYRRIMQNSHNWLISPAGMANTYGVLGEPTTIQRINLPVTNGDRGEPEVQCRVRFYPYSYRNSSLNTGIATDNAVIGFYRQYAFSNNETNLRNHFGPGLVTDSGGTTTYRWLGFVPQYNFYGCCNDPDQNGDMSDLLCEPFKTARTASLDFMERIDFIRGDRLAIVTFDRQAHVMDFDPGSDTEARIANVLERDVFISDQTRARRVMTEAVGVRTEPSFYRYATPPLDLQWDALVSPDPLDTDPNNPSTSRYDDLGAPFHTYPLTELLNHPVNSACPLQMAVLTYPYSQLTRVGTPRERYGTSAAPSVLDEIDSLPSWFPSSYGTLRVSPNTSNEIDGQYDRMERTYEYRASCAGTNIGAGLGQAATALGQLGRREGAVWIMVLLSDGAAGASAPGLRNGAVPPIPRYFTTDTSGNTVPQVPSSGASWYGAYGLCPYGPQTAPSEILQDQPFPFCSDVNPNTRNWCSDIAAAALPEQAGPNRIELTDDSVNPSASQRSNRCQTHYDVDDYARDWADYVAVRGINIFAPSASGTGLDTSRNDTDTLLPTIFTIAFGLEFSRTTGAPQCLPPGTAGMGPNPVYDCNIESYLGEELLRYIADAGDNFRIDNDYWQKVLGYRIPNQVSVYFDQNLPAAQTPDWGPPGPCEATAGTRGNWRPLTAGEDCGNYWAASTGGNELEQVFAEIAARMFTRLAG